MGACLTLGLMGSYVIALVIGRFGFKHDLRTATMQALVCDFPDMASSARRSWRRCLGQRVSSPS
jgi:hypothetical protein